MNSVNNYKKNHHKQFNRFKSKHTINIDEFLSKELILFELVLDQYSQACDISEKLKKQRSLSLSGSIALNISLKENKQSVEAKKKSPVKNQQNELRSSSPQQNEPKSSVTLQIEPQKNNPQQNEPLQIEPQKNNHQQNEPLQIEPQKDNHQQNEPLQIEPLRIEPQKNNHQQNEYKHNDLQSNALEIFAKASKSNGKLDIIDNQKEKKLFLDHPELFFSSDELQFLNIINLIYKGKTQKNINNNFYDLEKVKPII